MSAEETGTVCTRCVLNSSFPGIAFDDEGVCSVCRSREEKRESQRADNLLWPEKRKLLDGLCADAKAKKRTFDVLVPLSGGKDSMYVLYLAVKKLGLKPLAFTLDNGYLTSYARDNIDRACSILGVEHIYYCMDPALMRALFRTFLEKTGYFCSICMRAIGMATELVAEIYDIPMVFGGSASSVELPTSPEMFQSGAPDFVRNVLKDEPVAREAARLLYDGSLKRRLGYRLFWWGNQRHVQICAWINLPDYLEWNYATMFRTIKEELGWASPDGTEEEHIDCAIHKASAYIHDRRWKGSDLRSLTLAGLIMAGQLSREEALYKLEHEPAPQYPDSEFEPFLQALGMTRKEFDALIDKGPRYIKYRPESGKARLAAQKTKQLVFSAIGVKRI
jgi:hypothetical protein